MRHSPLTLTYIESTDTRFRIESLNVLRRLASSMLVLGPATLCVACLQHVRLVVALKSGQHLEAGISLSLVVAVGIVLISLTALVSVLGVRDNVNLPPRAPQLRLARY